MEITHKIIDPEVIYSAIIDVAKAEGAKLALLFGSFAKGDYSKRSDVDVIFVEDTNLPFVERIGKYFSALREHKPLKPFDIDVLVYTPAEFEEMRAKGRKFILRALREGKILYERGER